MPSQKAVTGSGLGHFVSFEGDNIAISEQLRLLPSSPDILIFPDLLDAIGQYADDVPFNPYSFVRRVHKIVSNRVDLARSFLQSSSHLQPRLAVANGGCLTARSICLSTLSDKCTNGNVGKAEELFLDIVGGGVVGLMGKQEEEGSSNPGVQDSFEEPILEEQQVSTPLAIYDSTTVRIKTATRQDFGAIPRYPPNGNNIDPWSSIDSSISGEDPYARTTATPLRCRSTAFSDQECEVAAKVVEDKAVIDCDRNVDKSDFRSCCHLSSISTFDDAMMYLESTEGIEKFMLSPWQEKLAFSPETTDYLMSDEHEIDAYQPPENMLMKTIRSVDNILPLGPDIGELVPGPLNLNCFPSAHCLGGEGRREEVNQVGLDQGGTQFPPSASHVRYPHQNSILCKTEKTSPVLTPQALSEPGNSVHDSVTFEGKTSLSLRQQGKRATQPFEPVFAICEDLVVLFVGEVLNKAFEYVLDSYRNGSYPVDILPCPLDDYLGISALSFPSPPGMSVSPFEQSSAPLHFKHDVKCHGKILNAKGIDKFASIESTLSANQARLDSVGSISGATLGVQALTLGSKVQDTTNKFNIVKSSANSDAVDVSKIWKALLSIPPFIQSTNPSYPPRVLAYDVSPKLTTELDEGLGNTHRPINRMLALGCEDGVDQHVYRKISKQVEKLCNDRTYGSVTHVLDIRDPILNAMEAFTSQSLSLQADGNPFSQPSLLAKLIVPYLESYRSTVDSRDVLLLQYPASYFSTIIALRELLDSDALQVASITKVNATSQLQRRRESSNPIVSYRANIPVRLSGGGSNSSAHRWNSSNQIPQTSAVVNMPFSKADFLLPNTATEPEISTFLSNIYNGLAKNNSFHTSDAPLLASSSSCTTISSTSSHHPHSPISPRRTFFSPRIEPLIRMSSSSYLNSVWSGEAARENARQKKTPSRDWENFYLDESEDEDEDEDELESIFMAPLLVPNPASTNSSKALKWLGIT